MTVGEWIKSTFTSRHGTSPGVVVGVAGDDGARVHVARQNKRVRDYPSHHSQGLGLPALRHVPVQLPLGREVSVEVDAVGVPPAVSRLAAAERPLPSTEEIRSHLMLYIYEFIDYCDLSEIISYYV